MKYPFLLAALLLCSANLAARHSDTDTLLQPDTLSLRQSDALSAQKSDAPFVRPPYLRPGDTIGIVTPARKLKEKADTAKVRERFEEWGLKVKFGAHYADREQPYFAGTDARRAADLQAMIDDPGVKAVVSYQGGYGSVRLLPLLDLTPLREQPKWIVGFSDVTMLHMALGRLGVESLHATMPGKFRFGADEKPEAIVSDESLRSALFGRWTRIDAAAHPLNVSGTARGRLAGGNLSLLCSAIGTPEQPDFDTPTVLFIEEIGEQMYPARPHDAAAGAERNTGQMQGRSRGAFYGHAGTEALRRLGPLRHHRSLCPSAGDSGRLRHPRRPRRPQRRPLHGPRGHRHGQRCGRKRRVLTTGPPAGTFIPVRTRRRSLSVKNSRRRARACHIFTIFVRGGECAAAQALRRRAAGAANGMQIKTPYYVFS